MFVTTPLWASTQVRMYRVTTTSGDYLPSDRESSARLGKRGQHAKEVPQCPVSPSFTIQAWLILGWFMAQGKAGCEGEITSGPEWASSDRGTAASYMQTILAA